MVSLFRGRLLLLLALAGGGCQQQGQNQFSDEEKEPHFIEAMREVNSMDYAAAVASFEKALSVNPQSAAAHMELGMLFDSKVPDPAAAIYHYEKYLKLKPNSDRAESIRLHILSCKQEIARTVSLGPVSEKLQRELEKLIEENKRLNEENKPLKEEVGKWRAYYAAYPPVPANSTAQSLAAKGSSLPATLPSARVEGAAGAPAPRPGPAALALGGSPTASGTAAVGVGAPVAVSTLGLPARAAPAATPRSHIVQPRETFGSIARQHGVQLEALLAANPELSPRRLRPGQKVNLPP